MRPVRLEMQGFTSFVDKTVVDFADADVLALVGPTGSGKSSIIDAITMALYGTVPRYRKENENKPAISTGAAAAKVRLDFELGGDTYTAARTIRRTGSPEASLEKNGEAIASSVSEMKEKVRAIIGLDFRQFTKTVVLPQGDFAAFLHDAPKDRQALLRQLLDLGVYARMGGEARERAKKFASQLELLEQQLAEEPDVSDERLAELQQAAAAVESARDQVGSLMGEMAAAEERRGRAEQTITECERWSHPLAALSVPDEVARVMTAIGVANQRAEVAATALAAARDAAAEAEDAAAAGPDKAKAEALLERHRERTGVQATIAELDQAVVHAAARNEHTRTAAEAARHQLEAAAAAVAAARVDRDTARHNAEAAGDVAEVTRIRDLYAQQQALTPAVAQAVDAVAAATAQAQNTTAAVADAGAMANEAHARRDRARAAAGAAGLVATLVAGQDCPVCRQTVTEIPDHDADAEVAAAEQAATEADGELAAADRADRNAHALVAKATAEHDQLIKQFGTVAAALAGAPGLDALAAKEEAIAAARELVVAADQVLVAAERAESTVRADPAVRQAHDEAQAAASALAAATARRDEAAVRLVELDRLLLSAADMNTLRAEVHEADRLAAARSAAIQTQRAAEAAASEATKAAAEAQSREDDLRRSFGAGRDAVAALSPPPVAGDSLLEDWQALAGWAQTISASQAATRAASAAELASAQTEVAAHHAAIEAAAAPFVDTVAAPAELAQSLADAVAHARSQVQALFAKRVEIEARLAQAEALESRRAVAASLGNHLKSNNFEQWLLEEAIGDLCERATERLRELSGGQYSLVAKGTDFQIRDHRNADELRDARTLSGGETFLTSLSLALALADNIAEMATEGSPRLGSIFLDEGFGTLDPETLDVVASAIEELGASGRMVGIVTHIRELADRMPVRLDVRKGPATSTVTRSEA